MGAQISQLLAMLDSAYNRPSWHGTNLRGSVRRVSVDVAVWRPGAHRHNIWETVIHCAYWKYATAKRFVASERGSFQRKGSNWFKVEDRSERAWKRDVALMDEMHAALRAAVARLSDADLRKTPPGKKVSNFVVLSGIAAHDLYHAGQIQLLKRLAKNKS